MKQRVGPLSISQVKTRALECFGIDDVDDAVGLFVVLSWWCGGGRKKGEIEREDRGGAGSLLGRRRGVTPK